MSSYTTIKRHPAVPVTGANPVLIISLAAEAPRVALRCYVPHDAGTDVIFTPVPAGDVPTRADALAEGPYYVTPKAFMWDGARGGPDIYATLIDGTKTVTLKPQELV